MKIVLRKASQEWVLANEFANPGRIGIVPGSWSNQVQAKVDKPDFAEATEGRSFFRGNVRTEVSFSVERTHMTLLECQNFATEHKDDIPKEGATLIITKGNVSDGFKISTLENVVVDKVTGSFDCLLSFHSYSFSGGVMVHKMIKP